MEKVEREVTFILTDEERLERARTLVQKMDELDVLTSEAKAEQKNYKGKAEIIVQEINRLATAVQIGEEKRMVECTVEKDYRMGEVRYVNPDTGEVVESRIMTTTERQQDFTNVINITPIAVSAPDKKQTTHEANNESE